MTRGAWFFKSRALPLGFFLKKSFGAVLDFFFSTDKDSAIERLEPLPEELLPVDLVPLELFGALLLLVFFLRVVGFPISSSLETVSISITLLVAKLEGFGIKMERMKE